VQDHWAEEHLPVGQVEQEQLVMGLVKDLRKLHMMAGSLVSVDSIEVTGDCQTTDRLGRGVRSTMEDIRRRHP
jgi:hypothetical protein